MNIPFGNYSIMASGRGTNALALMKKGIELKRPPQFVIVNKEDSPLRKQCLEYNIPCHFIPSSPKGIDKVFEEAVINLCHRDRVEWIFLAGFLKILSPEFLKAFNFEKGINRVINIHPSLLPKYPGLGGYKKAFENGDKVFGHTIHLVTSELDCGPVLYRKEIERKINMNLEEMQTIGLEIENQSYSQLLSEFIKTGFVMEKKNLKRIELLDKFPTDNSVLNFQLKSKGITAQIQKASFYKIEDISGSLSDDICRSVTSDPTLQHFFDSPYKVDGDIGGAISVSYLPGVTDNSGKALEEAFLLKGSVTKCYSGEIYFISGSEEVAQAAFEVLQREVGNPLIQEIEFIERASLLEGIRFKDIKLPVVHISHGQGAEEVSLELDEKGLMELSKDRCLALNLEEMNTIKEFYLLERNRKERMEKGLPFWPTDVELEVLAQTWSEHCKHKIFSSEIQYKDSETGEIHKVDSLYKSYIKKATKEIEEEGCDWLVSVFSDNAGIVRFDKNIDLCIKVETHNSPSALDPYGGAITGILGVNRDILGCGLGAKPIANTDVFCFASTELPHKIDPSKLPSGLMEPAKLLRGVHKGVEDGGNKSGIPTVNGAIVFDLDYAGKPLVFCGTIGTLPSILPDGREGKTKGAKAGDKIFVVGGAVGADGIHGATFSSMELNEDSPATAVQIGDPLTQKRVMDFLLKARDKGLYTCVTDNGAGGISSSIGEMAELTGGAKIDLDLHPRKYPGLSPWEIMISESQERMTFAVSPGMAESFLKGAREAGVVATCLGEFTSTGGLDIFYQEERVAWLPMDFLHDGVPKLKLEAIGNKSHDISSWVERERESLPADKNEILSKLLNCENIASKEYWVRQYDHEVQGATIGKPFPGKNGIGPGDSGAIDLEIHGGEADSMVIVGCGMAPRWSHTHAGIMAKLSVDEAVRNTICSGANPEKICLLDNFCWPDPVQSPKNPQGREKLGQLVDTCRSLYEICKLYKAPLVSGKDSMKNDFRGKNRAGDDLVISIKPTLLVTAMGHGHKSQILRSPVRREGIKLYRLGKKQITLLNSELHEIFGDNILKEDPNLTGYKNWDFSECQQTYQFVHKATKEHLIHNIHDISDGGLMVSLCEVLFDSGLGFKGNLSSHLCDLFGEGPGQFVIGVETDSEAEVLNAAKKDGVFLEYLGESTSDGECYFFNDKKNISSFLKSWKRDWSQI